MQTFIIVTVILFLILVRSNQSDQQYYSPLYSAYLFY